MSESKKVKKVYFFIASFVFTIMICSRVSCEPPLGSECGEIGSGLFYREPEKMIALTFDDGPHYKYTPMILDALKKYNAKATFFVIGERIKYTPEIIKRIHDEGHSIGNHTYSHSELTKIHSDKAYNEINKTNEAIFELTNQKPILVRPPLGARNKRTDAIIRDEGMSVILWNVDSRDWSSQNTNKIYSHVKKNAREGDIVLMHDFYLQSAEAVEMILEAFITDGFRFVTVNELIEAKYELEPGRVYYSQRKVLKQKD